MLYHRINFFIKNDDFKALLGDDPVFGKTVSSAEERSDAAGAHAVAAAAEEDERKKLLSHFSMNRSSSQNKLLEKYLNDSIRLASSNASINQAFIMSGNEQEQPEAPRRQQSRRTGRGGPASSGRADGSRPHSAERMHTSSAKLGDPDLPPNMSRLSLSEKEKLVFNFLNQSKEEEESERDVRLEDLMKISVSQKSAKEGTPPKALQKLRLSPISKQSEEKKSAIR